VTLDAIIVVGVLVGAVVLFVSERLRSDIVALLALATLLAAGILAPEEGFAGFANPATVTVAAMFVLSAGLERTGAVSVVGGLLERIGRRSPTMALVAMMAGVAFVSAFVNNTAAVAVMLPSVIALSRAIGVSPSKLLIPLSYASLFGGVCTLFGTSTNILVGSLAEDAGQRPFGVFELTPIGLVLLVCGTLYVVLVGTRLLPSRGASNDLAEEFAVWDYVLEIRLMRGDPSVGSPLGSAQLVTDLRLDVLAVERDGEILTLPRSGLVLHEGDVLRVRCDLDMVKRLEARAGVEVGPRRLWRDEALGGDDATLVEAVVAPSSVVEGQTLREIGLRGRFGATALAIRHHDRLVQSRLADTPLRGGDALLVELATSRVPSLRASREFVVVSERGSLAPVVRRAVPAVAVVCGVVAAAASGVVPIAVSAVIGALMLVLLGSLSVEEAYRSLDARVIVLLGGILPLGTALERTGVAALLAHGLVEVVGPLGPVAAMSAIFGVTSILTAVMSNTATAALLVPIALGVASALGVDPRPFLAAVAYGASTSFMTPMSYQTNLMVYGPGSYRFADYLRIGTPLTLMFWLLATLLVPLAWPFAGSVTP
jgi:di/tricarboxylate transporter